MRTNLFVIIASILSATALQAQQFEIRAVNKGNGNIGVEMRKTASNALTSSDFITDLVFGLKWQASYNIDLAGNLSTTYNIVKSGTRQQKGSYHYQAFSAANTPFAVAGSWPVGTWVEVLMLANTKNSSGTGLFEIAEKDFDATTDPNIGVNLVDFTPVINGSAAGVLLPVTLLRFLAGASPNMIQLQWTTSEEYNCKGFAIERAEAFSGNYEKVGWLAGKGNSATGHDYLFQDRAVNRGVSYSYRLQQVDLDDQYRYSEPKQVSIPALFQQAIRISPNPVRNRVQLILDAGTEKGPASILLFDTKGTLVFSREQELDPLQKASFGVPFLTSGQYFLIIRRKQGVLFSGTVLKQ